MLIFIDDFLLFKILIRVSVYRKVKIISIKKSKVLYYVGCIITIMTRKNNPRKLLGHGEVLSLSAIEVEDMLGLDSAPNVTYSNGDIVNHILNACSSKTSISNVSDICKDAPTEGTIRHRLRNLDLEEVQDSLNEKLKIHAVETVPNRPYICAIDIVQVPYYGKEKNSGDTIKTKPKQGTSRFFAYATIYLILRNKRYTLALKYVRKGETLREIVNFLIDEVQSAGLQIRRIYMDREFYNVKMINNLLKRKTAFIIPCVKRGSSGGIRKLLKGRKSYSTDYTMRSKDDEATFQVNVVVKYSKDKYKEKGVKHFAYAVHDIDIPIEKTFQEYRKRFAIESSYRIMNQARIHTSTKNPALRLLYMGISFLLANIWIYIQWTYLSTPRQGGRQPVKWNFKTMLKQINRATEDKLGFADTIPI